eukprot:TRINITY_DN25620_c0_g1_i1.p1 TRINITY_DN25620_c0_g1~~TRINITY_DN25620_c0_g1_i1.p1  ORF type:complete len:324 (-),score=55.69 TRINITY_DN25620_c0_g1_i1:9-980(-)
MWLLLHGASSPPSPPPEAASPRDVGGGSSSSSRVAQAPGVRQDHSTEFLRLRGLYLQRREELSGHRHRLEWLESIISSGDAQQLFSFVEVAKEASVRELKPDQTCALCAVRVRNIPKLKASAGYDEQEYQPACSCMICLRWHCKRHCTYIVGLGFEGQSVELKCCEACHRHIDVWRWHEEKPPSCLSELARELMIGHCELASELTSLAHALAQFEGLSRTMEELTKQPEALAGPSHEEAAQEYRSGLPTWRKAAEAAEAAVEAELRRLGNLSCGDAKSRNSRLRDALIRHGRAQMDVLKPRLRAAATRCSKLKVPEAKRRSLC